MAKLTASGALLVVSGGGDCNGCSDRPDCVGTADPNDSQHSNDESEFAEATDPHDLIAPYAQVELVVSIEPNILNIQNPPCPLERTVVLNWPSVVVVTLIP
jgi:hypothetical protein